MTLPSLDHLSDTDLHVQVKKDYGEERQSSATTVRDLAEVEKRGIYRDAGFSSLFLYARHYVGLSEGNAYRYEKAAKCLFRSPEVYEQLRSGEVSICALAEVSRVMNDENQTEVLKAVQGKSKREAERIAVQYGAPVKPKRESIRPRKVLQTEGPDLFSHGRVASPVERFSVSLELSNEGEEYLQEVKRHMGPCSLSQIFERALKELAVSFRPKKVRERKKGSHNLLHAEQCYGREFMQRHYQKRR